MNISQFIKKNMAIIVLVVAALALFVPSTGLWIQSAWINWLLAIIMFGMGATLSLKDFQPLLTRPWQVLIGCAAQFLIMPALAYVLCLFFIQDPALIAGVVLVGACPGGTSSNVITYLSKADVPYSVAMTSINTLLAPLLTPFIVWLQLRTTVEVNIASMFISIVQVVIVPIILGLICSAFFHEFTEKLKKFLPTVAVIGITLIVASVISHNSEKIMTVGFSIFAVVILHNLLGYTCGYGLGKILKFPEPQARELSIEVGMQNSGLAASLASTAFPNMAAATVPGAIFSVWHNISGAVLANIFRWMDERKTKEA